MLYFGSRTLGDGAIGTEGEQKLQGYLAEEFKKSVLEPTKEQKGFSALLRSLKTNQSAWKEAVMETRMAEGVTGRNVIGFIDNKSRKIRS